MSNKKINDPIAAPPPLPTYTHQPEVPKINIPNASPQPPPPAAMDPYSRKNYVYEEYAAPGAPPPPPAMFYNDIENWNKVENLRTLFGWITISALNIECLDEAIKRYRVFIAYGTIMGLLFSTALGTISATQFNISNTQTHIIFILNILFTFFSFSIATYTGILKTLQVQERLENFIKLKQEWILFSATISSEMQLPIHLRTPILSIIKVYKNKFLDLLKIDTEIPEFIKKDIIDRIKKKEEEKYKNNRWADLKYSESSSLSDVIMEIGSQELKRLVNQVGVGGDEGSGDVGGIGDSGGGAQNKDDIVTRRDIENIYNQFAIITKNVEKLKTPLRHLKKNKFNMSFQSLTSSVQHITHAAAGGGGGGEKKRKSIAEIVNGVSSTANFYKNILDGSLAASIDDDILGDSDEHIAEYKIYDVYTDRSSVNDDASRAHSFYGTDTTMDNLEAAATAAAAAGATDSKKGILTARSI